MHSEASSAALWPLCTQEPEVLAPREAPKMDPESTIIPRITHIWSQQTFSIQTRSLLIREHG